MNGFIKGAANGIPDPYQNNSEVTRPCFEFNMDHYHYGFYKSSALNEIHSKKYDVVKATHYLSQMGLALFNKDCKHTVHSSYIEKMR